MTLRDRRPSSSQSRPLRGSCRMDGSSTCATASRSRADLQEGRHVRVGGVLRKEHALERLVPSSCSTGPRPALYLHIGRREHEMRIIERASNETSPALATGPLRRQFHVGTRRRRHGRQRLYHEVNTGQRVRNQALDPQTDLSCIPHDRSCQTRRDEVIPLRAGTRSCPRHRHAGLVAARDDPIQVIARRRRRSKPTTNDTQRARIKIASRSD